MDPKSFLSARLDRGSVPLAVGDVVVILTLLTAGTLQHQTASFLQENPMYLAAIYAPFLVGWVIAAPIVGAYSPGAVESAKASIPLALRSWIPAVVIALLLRVAGVFHGGAALAFAIVVTGLGLISLGVWRYLYFKLRG